MRLAGTWKQYSKKAIIQLIMITLNNGTSRYFSWPYQAKVMKMLETVSRAMVRMCLGSFRGPWAAEVYRITRLLEFSGRERGVATVRWPRRSWKMRRRHSPQ